jgi:RNA polymerase primary sigma factor
MRLLDEKGREPTIEEIAQAASLSVEETSRLLKIRLPRSPTIRRHAEKRDSDIDDPIAYGLDESPISAATLEALREKIDQVLKTLTYREREIIKLRYGLGDGYTYTLEEIARIFKVSRERVRQIEAEAMRKLRHPPHEPAG